MGTPLRCSAARHPPPYCAKRVVSQRSGAPERHGAARRPPPYCAKRVVVMRSGVPRRAWCRPAPTAVLRETRGFAAQRGAQKGVVPLATHRRKARNAWFCSAAGCPEGHGAARHPPPYCVKRVVLQRIGVPRTAWCRSPPTAVLRETRGVAAQRGAQKDVVPLATHRRTARNAWFCSAAGCPEGRGAARQPPPYCAKHVVLQHSGVSRRTWCRSPPTAVLRETRGFAAQRGAQKDVVPLATH